MICGVTLLMVWDWDHIVVFQPLVDHQLRDGMSYVYLYGGIITQTHVGDTWHW